MTAKAQARRVRKSCRCGSDIEGAGTFELPVIVTDLDAYSQLSIKMPLNLPNVKDIHTSFSLGEVKAGAALPLAHLGPSPSDR